MTTLERKRQQNRDSGRRWREAHPEEYALRQRKAWLKRAYAMTLEEFDNRLAAQGGGCAICGLLKPRMSVDHDHSCCPGMISCGNCIRGILCTTCNSALGGLQDDPKLLESALDYVRSFA